MVFKDLHIDLKLALIEVKLTLSTNFGVKNSFLASRTMSDKKTNSLENYRFSATSSCLHWKLIFDLSSELSVLNYPYILSLS